MGREARTQKYRKLPGLLFSGLLIVTGCSPEPGPDALETYLGRLANVVEVSPPPEEWQTLDLPRLPALPRDRMDDNASSLSLLEFLSLFGCELQTVIGAHNSSLGKLAPPSQKLLYELKFLHFAPACQDELRTAENAELASKLAAVVTQKQQQLPNAIWRVILQGEEARHFWKSPASLGRYPENAADAVVQSVVGLDALVVRWLAGEYDAGWDTLESLLYHIHFGDGGALRKALQLYGNGLVAANRVIESRTAVWCFQGRPAINAIAAENVVQKLFVAEVQSWAAGLNRRYYQLIPKIQQLESRLSGVEPAAYRTWRIQRDREMQAAISASRTHVGRLKRLLDPCN